MARGFGSTFGTGATDTVRGPQAVQVPVKHSIAICLYENGLGGSSGGVPFCVFDGSNFYGLYTGAGAWHYGVPFSGGSGDWSIVKPTLAAAWHRLVMTYDGGAVGNKPVFTLNSTVPAVTTNTTPVGTFTVGAPVTPDIGNLPADTAFVWDGMLAHVAYWETILTPAEALSYCCGVNPIFLQPQNLKFYAPLDGINTPEPALLPGGFCTTTGVKRASSEPPMMNINGIWRARDANNLLFAPAPAVGQLIPFPWSETSGGMQDLTGNMRG